MFIPMFTTVRQYPEPLACSPYNLLYIKLKI